MIVLQDYGWNIQFQSFLNTADPSLKAGRITSVKGFKYQLILEDGELEAELSGKILFSYSAEDLPKVGDWVFCQVYDSLGYIIDVIPRMNEVFRKVAGKKFERQVLAANVDCAFIVQALDRDFNIMRLDRYIVQMINCKVKPVVVLNKCDLVPDHDLYKREIAKLNRDVEVYFCSTYSGYGIEQLTNEILFPGKTFIMIGSSGVGKSSLLKSLLPDLSRDVNEVSDSTGKGKHTTTTRDLFQLPNGALIIDTPGMREFGISLDDDQMESGLFPGIDNFAVECRYDDCKHIHETGCGVLKALAEGKLSEEAYESYIKLTKEQRHFQLKAEDLKRLGKQFGKMTREAQDHRKKFKF